MKIPWPYDDLLLMLLLFLLALAATLLSGCTFLWHDDFIFIDIANARDLRGFALIIEPNSIKAYAQDSIKDPDDITVITGGVIAGTKGGK